MIRNYYYFVTKEEFLDLVENELTVLDAAQHACHAGEPPDTSGDPRV